MTILYRKILIPLDGSPLAECILAHLPCLARPEQTELVLVSVVETERYRLSLMAPLRAHTETYINQQCEKLQRLGYRVHAQIVDGDAAQAILNTATAVEADLIAMTTHGHAGFVRWALGSVAERVIQEADLPIFLVREAMNPVPHKIRHILVPLDGSPLAKQVLPAAQALAQATGAKILLLHVIQELDAGNRQILFASEEEATATFAAWRADAELELTQITGALQAAGIATEHQIIFGTPVPIILQTIVDQTIDLIVMTTHGYTGFKRWFYGSVANKVLRGANCPLLLVRNQPSGEDTAERQI